jgi:hypothetical protein
MEDFHHLIYNISPEPKEVFLEGTYFDINFTPISSPIKIPPHSAELFFKRN